MIVKFFKTKANGNPLGGLNYLLHENRTAKPEVLFGNPAITEQLLLQNEFTRAYTTGVLSFKEKSEDVDLATQMHLCKSFEKTLLAGVRPDQYDCIWIRHTDKKDGRLELNFHIVNKELTTGKRLQVYYEPVDKYRIRTWKNLQNDIYQFADPNAPENKRFFDWNNNFNSRREVTDRINKYMQDKYVHNELSNRNDVLEALNKIPNIKITRETKSAISITLPQFEKPFRLKGELYERSFRTSGQLRETEPTAQKKYEEERENRIRDNSKKLKQLNSSFAKKRYRHFSKFKCLDSDNNDSCDLVERIPDEQILEEHLSRVQKLHSNEKKQALMSDRLASLRAQIELPEAEEKPTATDEQEIINRLEKVRYESAANQLINTGRIRRIATAIREAIATLRERTQELEEIIFFKREQRLADLTGNDKRNELRAEEQHVREVQQSKVLPTNNKSKNDRSGLAL